MLYSYAGTNKPNTSHNYVVKNIYFDCFTVVLQLFICFSFSAYAGRKRLYCLFRRLPLIHGHIEQELEQVNVKICFVYSLQTNIHSICLSQQYLQYNYRCTRTCIRQYIKQIHR